MTTWRADLRASGIAGVGLLALFVGVALNRYRFENVPLRPHLEHFALVGAVLILGWLWFKGRGRFGWRWGDLLLGAYLVLALGSAWLFPPEPRESVQYWFRMLIAAAVYFVARALIFSTDTRAAFRTAVRALLVFGALEAAFGIASWFLYPLGVNLGVDEYPLGVRGPGGILCNFSLTMYGTLWEPNIFASTLVAITLVAAMLFVSSEFRAWRTWLGIAMALMVVAIGLNASRAALALLAVGLIAVVLLGRGMAWQKRLVWAAGALVLVGGVSVASLELSRGLMQLPSAPGLATRAPCAAWLAEGMPRGTSEGDPLFDPATGPEGASASVQRLLEGQTLASRWVSYQLALNDFAKRPWLGNGPNAFGQTYTTTAHTPGWISNMVLMSLHDTGVVGTLLLLAWLGIYAVRVWQVLRDAPQGELRTLMLAMGLGLLSIFVAYQATTMLWFGLVWWVLAVVEGGSGRLQAAGNRRYRTSLTQSLPAQAKTGLENETAV